MFVYPIQIEYEGKIQSWKMTKNSIHLTYGGNFLEEYHLGKYLKGWHYYLSCLINCWVHYGHC